MSRLVTKKRGVAGAFVLVATLAGTLAVQKVGGDEGLRLKTYKDIVGVSTYCYGEIKGAKMGQVYTKAQCDALLLKRLDEFANHVESCITKPMSDKTEVAFTSLAYNIGWGGFCKSSVVRLYNQGKSTEACDAMKAFNRAGGRPVPGLTARRGRESKLCKEGLK